jgi:L-aminopeptidase/D-esterase-like protein
VLVDGVGAVGAVSQRGGGPGTRETDILSLFNRPTPVNGIVFSGGSAFGLDTAGGVVRWLEEHDVGYPTIAGKVPIVPAAILFDLAVGDARIRPDAASGYRAAARATADPVEEGSVGAGAGATVGKIGRVLQQPLGFQAMKGGVGSSAIRLPNGLVIAALVVVNAIGDIVDPDSGQLVAGVRAPDGQFADARRILRMGPVFAPARPGENTTLAVVATNAALTPTQVARAALMADDGVARAIVPAHTPWDGDTVFALATGRWTGDVNPAVIGALAADAVADAIVRAVRTAKGVDGFPGVRDLR